MEAIWASFGGTMAQPFYDYTNRNRIGKIGLLETDFGFHVVKITDKEDVVLLAEIVREIVPSDETSNRVFREATELITAKEKRDLEEAATAANLSIKDPTQIDILDELIPGIGMQRNIVQWAFEDDTQVGTIRRFSLSKGGYAVVQLSDKLDAGLQTVDQAREMVTPILQNQKRLELLTEKFASASSLETFGEASETEIKTASAHTRKYNLCSGVGQEPYVIEWLFIK